MVEWKWPCERFLSPEWQQSPHYWLHQVVGWLMWVGDWIDWPGKPIGRTAICTPWDCRSCPIWCNASYTGTSSDITITYISIHLLREWVKEKALKLLTQHVLPEAIVPLHSFFHFYYLLIHWHLSPAASSVSWSPPCFVCSGPIYEIYNGSGPSKCNGENV